MITQQRTAFYLSDRTGITAETLGHSLLTQFEQIAFQEISIPFIDSPAKARRAVERINQTAQEDGARPICFSTLVDTELHAIVRQSKGFMLDLFGTFIGPLEEELQVASSHTVGRAHGMTDMQRYRLRIEAMNFAMDADDGASDKDYQRADIILVGVSRCGKTPTCLYLALQYGLFAGNYPLLEEDLVSGDLPAIIAPYRQKLYGLLIDPERLAQIRQERRPNSSYASLQRCKEEIRACRRLFEEQAIPWIDTTIRSIEEIAATILAETGLQRRLF